MCELLVCDEHATSERRDLFVGLRSAYVQRDEGPGAFEQVGGVRHVRRVQMTANTVAIPYAKAFSDNFLQTSGSTKNPDGIYFLGLQAPEGDVYAGWDGMWSGTDPRLAVTDSAPTSDGSHLGAGSQGGP